MTDSKTEAPPVLKLVPEPRLPNIVAMMPSRTSPEYNAVRALEAALHTVADAKLANVHLGMVRGEPVHDVRNCCVEEARKRDADFLFFVDDDTIVQPDSLLKLYKLIVTDGRIGVTTGVTPVCKGGQFYSNVVPPSIYESTYKSTVMLPLWPDGIFEVGGCGSSCILIDMNVYKELEAQGETPYRLARKPTGVEKEYVGEDMDFCFRARKLTWRIMCDGSVRCNHIKELGLAEIAGLCLDVPPIKHESGVNILRPIFRNGPMSLY